LFFVLLFSLCKTDVEKIKQISASFKENPPGSPFVFTGQSSNLDKAAQQLEKLDVPDDVEINASDKGVEVTFRRTVSFEQGSTEISEKAVKAMKKMLPIIGQMQNDIEISGHTDDTDINNRFPSNWEMSVARASAIAGFLEANKIAPERMQVVGYGDSRPRFNADTAYKRALNRRVEILLLPEEQTR
jgi:Flagellar motor protein